MSGDTLPGEYFDRLYEHDADPWRISTGWYEQRKRALTTAVLPDPHYDTVIEIGCANGDLTEHLAPRCDTLIAVESSARAVQTARGRLQPHGHVDIRQGRVPQDCPTRPGNLIVLSEVGYYLSAADLHRTLDVLLGAAVPAAVLLAVHWRHEAADYPQRGDEVHELIAARAELESVSTYADDDIRLDVLSVGATGSVARRYGVL